MPFPLTEINDLLSGLCLARRRHETVCCMDYAFRNAMNKSRAFWEAVIMSRRVPALAFRMEGRSMQPEEDAVGCKFQKYTPMFHRVLDLSADVTGPL